MSQAPLLVYGLGRSGLPVVERARAAAEPVLFLEARASGGDIDRALELGATRVAGVREALERTPAPLRCVAAPGVPIDHPDLLELRRLGVEIIGEVLWTLQRTPGRVIGVTGTAGKGSVTRWISDSLIAAGVDALAGGNIDPALAAVARPGATMVVELSSFQLERSPGLAPDVAVVLNLGNDHLDRHGTLERYHDAKRNLVRDLPSSSTFVGNADDPTIASWLEATTAQPKRFSLRSLDADATLDHGVLTLQGEALLARSELHVQGDHQVANALASALALQAVGLPIEGIRQGLRRFRGLPGRYASVGTLGGVRFIEDSIATRALAVRAALEATPGPVVWIVGGADKGADVDELAESIRGRVTLTLGVGSSGARFAAAAGRYSASEALPHPGGYEALKAAVERAIDHLHSAHQGNGSVLLAPLAASFDQFRDYQDRAATFRRCVEEVAQRVAAEEGAVWIPSS